MRCLIKSIAYDKHIIDPNTHHDKGHSVVHLCVLPSANICQTKSSLEGKDDAYHANQRNYDSAMDWATRPKVEYDVADYKNDSVVDKLLIVLLVRMKSHSPLIF